MLMDFSGYQHVKVGLAAIGVRAWMLGLS